MSFQSLRALRALLIVVAGLLGLTLIAEALSPPAPQAQGVLASWAHAAYGRDIGKAGLVSAQVNGQTEIYVAAMEDSGAHYWYALRWNAAAARMDQVFVSDSMGSEPIKSLQVQRVSKSARHIVVAIGTELRRYDLQSKALLNQGPGPCAGRFGTDALRAADLNGDGTDELIAICNDQTLVVEGPGYAGWTLAGVSGRDIAVGQMDNDPALEIATTGGHVVDSATRSVQWFSPAGFGGIVRAGDVDGDGRDELISTGPLSRVYIYDVELQQAQWSIEFIWGVNAIEVADLDGNGVKELLVGSGQWGSINVYEGMKQVLEGQIANPHHTIKRMLAADVTGDGKPEILFGTEDLGRLVVADWPSRSIRWQSHDLVGPFLGPVVGDLDGDGVPEVVIATKSSDSTGLTRGGRIIVLDSRTMAVRATLDRLAVGLASVAGVQDLKLRDIDGDGKLEILVGIDYVLSGLVEAYSYSSDNRFTLLWRNTSYPRLAPFATLEVADLDGDGRPDVVAGASYETGHDGNFVYVFDTTTGAEKWRTPHLGGFSVSHVAVGDFDADGQLEIAIGVPGVGVRVVSAATHAIKATIAEPGFTSLTRLDAFAIPRLIVGTQDGRAGIYAFDGGTSYYEVQSLQLGTGPIDGITVGNNRSWWVASNGVLARYAGSTKLAESANYGRGFGRTVESIGYRGGVFSTGSYGLHRVDIAR